MNSRNAGGLSFGWTLPFLPGFEKMLIRSWPRESFRTSSLRAAAAPSKLPGRDRNRARAAVQSHWSGFGVTGNRLTFSQMFRSNVALWATILYPRFTASNKGASFSNASGRVMSTPIGSAPSIE